MADMRRCVDMVQQSCDPWQQDLWCHEDGRYARSFALDDGSGAPKEFLERFGFVVFRDVLTASESECSVNAIFDECERGSDGCFQRHDPASWHHFPRDGMEKYGCPNHAPAMSEVMLRNRAHPRVHDAFAQLLLETELLCNYDRVCFHRPTRGEHGLEAFATESNLHLDMNPWHYLNNTDSARESLDSLGYRTMRDFFRENNAVFASDGLQLQGVLNFADNLEEDGGFWCVPGFNRIFDAVFGAIPMPAKQSDALSLRFGQPREMPALALLQRLAMRVPMRAGSLVLWDQRTPHGTCRNTSARPRFSQMLKLFPRRLVTPERLARRAALLRRELRGLPADLVRSEVFGLVAPAAVRLALLPAAQADDAHEPSAQEAADAIELSGRQGERENSAERRCRRASPGPASDATGEPHDVPAAELESAPTRRWRHRGGRSGVARKMDGLDDASRDDGE